MLVPLESSSALLVMISSKSVPICNRFLLVMISSKSVPICNRFHARRANSGKITISYGGTPLWCPRSREISSLSGTKFAHKKLETLWWKPAISILPGSWQTDRRTDRIIIANTSVKHICIRLFSQMHSFLIVIEKSNNYYRTLRCCKPPLSRLYTCCYG